MPFNVKNLTPLDCMCNSSWRTGMTWAGWFLHHYPLVQWICIWGTLAAEHSGYYLKKKMLQKQARSVVTLVLTLHIILQPNVLFSFTPTAMEHCSVHVERPS